MTIHATQMLLKNHTIMYYMYRSFYRMIENNDFIIIRFVVAPYCFSGRTFAENMKMQHIFSTLNMSKEFVCFFSRYSIKHLKFKVSVDF